MYRVLKPSLHYALWGKSIPGIMEIDIFLTVRYLDRPTAHPQVSVRTQFPSTVLNASFFCHHLISTPPAATYTSTTRIYLLLVLATRLWTEGTFNEETVAKYSVDRRTWNTVDALFPRTSRFFLRTFLFDRCDFCCVGVTVKIFCTCAHTFAPFTKNAGR